MSNTYKTSGREGTKVKKENTQWTISKCMFATAKYSDETVPLILLTPKTAEVHGTCRRAQKANTQRTLEARMVVDDCDAVQSHAYLRADKSTKHTT